MTTSPEILLDELQILGLPFMVTSFIQHILFNRNLKWISQGTLITKRNTNSGLPQGSTLSPILYAMCVRKIVDVLSPGIKILQFADDMAIYCRSAKLQQALISLELQCNIINHWLSHRNLQLSPQKTQLVIITRHRLPFPLPTIIITNFDIIPSPQGKFLGVWFDSKLNWAKQIESLKTKCLYAFKVMVSISRVKWGADVYSPQC